MSPVLARFKNLSNTCMTATILMFSYMDGGVLVCGGRSGTEVHQDCVRYIQLPPPPPPPHPLPRKVNTFIVSAVVAVEKFHVHHCLHACLNMSHHVPPTGPERDCSENPLV